MTTRYLFLSSESEPPASYPLNKISNDYENRISHFKFSDYGTEIESIGIIMICLSPKRIDSGFYPEKRYINRKNRYADIRLSISFERFCVADMAQKELLVADNIIKSIEVVRDRSKGDFRGDDLINDILNVLDITRDQLETLNENE